MSNSKAKPTQDLLSVRTVQLIHELEAMGLNTDDLKRQIYAQQRKRLQALLDLGNGWAAVEDVPHMMRRRMPTPDGTLFVSVSLPENHAAPATSDTGLEWPNGELVYLEPLPPCEPLPEGCDRAVWSRRLIEEVNADLERVGLPHLMLVHPIKYQGTPPGVYSTVVLSDDDFEAVLNQARSRRWTRVWQGLLPILSQSAPSAMEIIPQRRKDGTLMVALFRPDCDPSPFFRVPPEAELEFWRLWQEYANRLAAAQAT